MGFRRPRGSCVLVSLVLCASCSALTPFGEFRFAPDGAYDTTPDATVVKDVGIDGAYDAMPDATVVQDAGIDGTFDLPDATIDPLADAVHDGSDAGGGLDSDAQATLDGAVEVPDALAPHDGTFPDCVDCDAGIDGAPLDISMVDLPPPCPESQQRCGGTCVDLSSNNDHCGVCGNRCALPNASASCRSGHCTIVACLPSRGDCNGLAADGCEVDLRSDPAHCGACNNACVYPNASATCADGVCRLGACAAGMGNCNGNLADGCETDLTSHVEHCGSCGNACVRAGTVASCVGGTCGRFMCAEGYGDCNKNDADGCEVDLRRNASHCGRCLMPCAFGMMCAGGLCQSCPMGMADCNGQGSDGCETRLSEVHHCGRCGNRCTLPNATPQCSPPGVCTIAACAGGYGNCDGNDANGCETNLLTTPQHCGRCGNSCAVSNAATVCTRGSCQITSCAAGWGNCNGNVADGCETMLTNNPLHCGACGNRCATGLCRGTECVNFGGVVATADHGLCTAYGVVNPYTGNFGCTSGTSPTLYRRIIDCPVGSLTGASLYLCSASGASGTYAGAYELVNCPGRGNICIPNPYTNGCSCPAGSSPMSPMVIHSDAPGCGGLHTGQLVFCYRPMLTAGFGGAWQLRDGNVCFVTNPFTGGCTCPTGYNAARIRVVMPTPFGAFIGICYR